MLFKRRNPQPFWAKIKNLLWPRMGWLRVLSYYKHRTLRISDSEHSIAMALSFGCAVSWTPAFGTHILQCFLFCWITRTNILAALIGTAFGNPWSTPLLMVISFHVGKALFVSTGYGHLISADTDTQSFGDFMLAMMNLEVTWAQVSTNFRELIVPTLLGGYTMGLATFPFYYFPTYYMIKGARAARRARIRRIVHKEIMEVTGQEKETP